MKSLVTFSSIACFVSLQAQACIPSVLQAASHVPTRVVAANRNSHVSLELRRQLDVVVYRSTYSLSLSYGAASRGCGEDRESNAVRRSLRIVAQGDPLLLGRGGRRCICPGRQTRLISSNICALRSVPVLACRHLAAMLVTVVAARGLVVLRALFPNLLARLRVLAPVPAA